MTFIQWLQHLGTDADPSTPGFQARTLYVVICLAMPITIGVLVGTGLRAIERCFGVELGRGGH
jgi:hypothetical protein